MVCPITYLGSDRSSDMCCPANRKYTSGGGESSELQVKGLRVGKKKNLDIAP